MIGWATTKLPSTTSHRHCFTETSAVVAGEPSSSFLLLAVADGSSREIWCRKLGKSSAIDKRTRKGEEDKIWCRRTSGFAPPPTMDENESDGDQCKGKKKVTILPPIDHFGPSVDLLWCIDLGMLFGNVRPSVQPPSNGRPPIPPPGNGQPPVPPPGSGQPPVPPPSSGRPPVPPPGSGRPPILPPSNGRPPILPPGNGQPPVPPPGSGRPPVPSLGNGRPPVPPPGHGRPPIPPPSSGQSPVPPPDSNRPPVPLPSNGQPPVPPPRNSQPPIPPPGSGQPPVSPPSNGQPPVPPPGNGRPPVPPPSNGQPPLLPPGSGRPSVLPPSSGQPPIPPPGNGRPPILPPGNSQPSIPPPGSSQPPIPPPSSGQPPVPPSANGKPPVPPPGNGQPPIPSPGRSQPPNRGQPPVPPPNRDSGSQPKINNLAKLLTNGGGVEGGGTTANAPAAGDYGAPQSIANKHDVLRLPPNLNIFPVNAALYMDHKPPTATPPLSSGNKSGLHGLEVAGAVRSHHKVRPDGGPVLEQFPITGRNPRRKITPLGEPGPASLEVCHGGAEPRLGVEIRAFHGGVKGSVELQNGIFVEAKTIRPGGFFSRISTLKAEPVGLRTGAKSPLHSHSDCHLLEIRFPFEIGVSHEVFTLIWIWGLVAQPVQVPGEDK
nr:basic proline-rich protein-like [Ipomoea batatas]